MHLTKSFFITILSYRFYLRFFSNQSSRIWKVATIALFNIHFQFLRNMKAKRTGILLKPDPTRVLFRPLEPAREERYLRIIARILALSETETQDQLKQVEKEFYARHQKVQHFFLKRFEQIRHHLPADQPVSEERKLFIGAYFTQEYSLESAALFNPSIVWHPDQSELEEGSRRFILNRFVSLEELIEFIGAADIYLTPYLNPAQIVSGTLAYTLGAGKAIVSTPYWHAEELLAEGRGLLVPFGDTQAIVAQVISAGLEAYRMTGDKRWHKEAQRTFDWFLGRNDLHLPLYDSKTGGCHDGFIPIASIRIKARNRRWLFCSRFWKCSSPGYFENHKNWF